MIPSLPINGYYQTCSRWPAARHAHPHNRLVDSHTATLANTLPNPQRAHSYQLARADIAAKPSVHCLPSHLIRTVPVPKSP